MCIHLYQQTLGQHSCLLLRAPPSRAGAGQGRLLQRQTTQALGAKPSSWETSGLGDLEPITYLSSQQLSFLSQVEIRPTPPSSLGAVIILAKYRPGSVNPQLKVRDTDVAVSSTCPADCKRPCHALSLECQRPCPALRGFPTAPTVPPVWHHSSRTIPAQMPPLPGSLPPLPR